MVAAGAGGSAASPIGLGLETGRVGQVHFGPNSEAGLLPTPTTQEMAARRGRDKMSDYDNVGPLNHEEEGSRAWVPNGLGWLGLEPTQEEDELSLAGRPEKWAEPNQRAAGLD
ncbi:unnamed protein product [Linum trigynum]|uniref:Uncharacterized protein n=1 Tax=Linum trigynum TaxID=586398 RepID=A0AAV2DRE7_9ROSI